jgi:excisionase family DNA binding protein
MPRPIAAVRAIICPDGVICSSPTSSEDRPHGDDPQAALEPLLTVRQIADATDFDARSVRRWIKAGRLKAIRLGRRLRIRPADFLKFLEENEANKLLE